MTSCRAHLSIDVLDEAAFTQVRRQVAWCGSRPGAELGISVDAAPDAFLGSLRALVTASDARARRVGGRVTLAEARPGPTITAPCAYDATRVCLALRA